MRRKETIIIAMVVLAILCLYITLLLGTGSTLAASINHLSKAPSLPPSPTATVASTGTAYPAANLDPAVWAALIGLLGVIVGALIGGAFAIYQMRRNYQHDQEMERLRKELEAQYKSTLRSYARIGQGRVSPLFRKSCLSIQFIDQLNASALSDCNPLPSSYLERVCYPSLREDWQ